MVAGYILLAEPVAVVAVPVYTVVAEDHQAETVDGGDSLNHM